MIFRTITDETTGVTKSIGLFGKPLHELKETFSSIKTNGIIKTFFDTPTIDTKVVRKYNSEIEKASANGATFAEKQEIMKSAMKGTNKATAQLIGSTKGAIVETEALADAQKQFTLAFKAAEVGMKAVSIACNMLLFWGIAKGIQLLAKGMSELNDDYADLKNRIENLKSTYDEQTQSINRINEKMSDN